MNEDSISKAVATYSSELKSKALAERPYIEDGWGLQGVSDDIFIFFYAEMDNKNEGVRLLMLAGAFAGFTAVSAAFALAAPQAGLVWLVSAIAGAIGGFFLGEKKAIEFRNKKMRVRAQALRELGTPPSSRARGKARRSSKASSFDVPPQD